jgi:uncharacterized membrane protein YphA (DoxX/SURF4 family)
LDIPRARLGHWPAVRPWLGAAVRLGLAAVWLAAGASKVTDLAASGRAVNAYQVMPYDVAKVIGAALPFVEIALGLLLVAGLATRLAGVVSAALLAVFVAGISSAWARGLSIDCGCFGGGGQLEAGQSPSYGSEIARDIGFGALAAFLIAFPVTRLSLDRWLSAPELFETEPAQAEVSEAEPAQAELPGAEASGAEASGAEASGAEASGAAPPGAEPTGAAPTGAAPTGAAPTGAAPTGAAPTGAAPTGAAPTGAAPTGAAPTGESRHSQQSPKRR